MNKPPPPKKIPVQCPTCKKDFFYFDSEFRPFCCEKCKLLDLGKWLDESYAIPVKIQEEDENDSDDLKDEG